MSNRSMKVTASALAIALGLAGVGAIGFAEGAVAQSVEDKKKEADRILMEGAQQFNLGQYQLSIDLFEKSLKLYREIQDLHSEGRVFNNLGLIYDKLNNSSKATQFYEKGLLIARQVNNKDLEIIVLGNLGRSYKTLGKYQQAIEYYRQRLSVSRESKDTGREIHTLVNLSDLCELIERYSEAISYHEKLLAIARDRGMKEEEASRLIRIGILHSRLGDYSQAIQYQEKVLIISAEIKNLEFEISALSNIGISHRSLGAYSKAIEYQEKALRLARDIKNKDMEGSILGNLGNIYEDLGNYDKAIEYQEKNLELAKESQDRAKEGTANGNLGNSYRAMGNYLKAIEYYEKHLAISNEFNNLQGQGSALGNLGLIYYAERDYSKSLQYLQKALEISRKINDRKGESASLGNLGNIYYALQEYATALEYHYKYLSLARSTKDQKGEYLALNHLGFDLAPKNPDLAITFYKKSINIAEVIRSDLRKLPREDQERYTSTVAGTYRNLANLLLTQGRTREAQAILELLKVQEFQIYDSQQQQPSLQFPLHPLENQIWQQVEQQKSLTLESLNTIAQPLTQNRDRITKEMNNQPIAIGNPNKLLNTKPNSLLIQNLVVGDKIWTIWTNTKGETKTIAQNVTQKELTETVKILREDYLSTPSSSLKPLQALSQKLHNWLIPPALQTELAQNPNLHLFFSLDHLTRYIPIAALYDGQKYLIQKHTISNLITTDTDMTDRFSPPDRPTNILALGTSKAVGGFSALPDVESELYAIVKTQNSDKGIYPGTIQLNEAFTANSLRNPNPHRVLHIATHGSFNPKSITASFLLLGNGDKLPITEIANLTNLNDKHLVVLSACESGISGNSSDGTEISGISNYFLRRGAKSVLASLWQVNDPATALLMRDFYQKLNTNNTLTKAEALRQTQLAFLNGDRTHDNVASLTRGRKIASDLPDNSLVHPHYWAPFVLVGNSQ